MIHARIPFLMISLDREDVLFGMSFCGGGVTPEEDP